MLLLCFLLASEGYFRGSLKGSEQVLSGFLGFRSYCTWGVGGTWEGTKQACNHPSWGPKALNPYTLISARNPPHTQAGFRIHSVAASLYGLKGLELQDFDLQMGCCQNYGPSLGPYYSTAPNI